MKLLRRVSSQEMMNRGLPFGYGVAWMSYAYDAWILAPVPLNLLFRWARDAWRWMRQGPRRYLFPAPDSQVWQRIRALEGKFEDMDQRVRNMSREMFH